MLVMLYGVLFVFFLLEPCPARPNGARSLEVVYKFKRTDIHIAVNSETQAGKVLLPVSNYYLRVNKTTQTQEKFPGVFFIRSSDRYMNRSEISSGSVVPSPFNLTSDGLLLTAGLMAEYNHDKFELVVVGLPGSGSTDEAIIKITVWISEPEDQLKILLNKTLEEVNEDVFAPLSGLVNVTTPYLLVPSGLKDFIDNKNLLFEDKCLLYIHVINPNKRDFVPVSEILRLIDEKYDILKTYYNASQSGIVSITPALQSFEGVVEPAVAALIALLVVVSVAFITTILSCCCLHYWPEKRRKHSSSKPPIPTNLGPEPVKVKAVENSKNGTDNPLWMERPTKPYEEQELTMKITEGDSPSPRTPSFTNGRSSSQHYMVAPLYNTYATIQKPVRYIRNKMRGADSYGTLMLGDEPGESSEYTNLDFNPNRSPPGPRIPGVKPAKLATSIDEPDTPNVFFGSTLTLNKSGEPQLVSDLL
ncbi:cadherin-87A-like isoform X2 [Artemia franciscana]|uniref:Uncharacterized protein n=1 Tax=Artemia franciscana TaxID=6661 RepID=A0AA88L3X4_ARTSF|nr:hypothetical protein QYM36_006650 [Artemia franciscana]